MAFHSEHGAPTQMCAAAFYGDVQHLKTLINDYKIKVDEGDYDKRTAIHLAASAGHLEVVKALVEELNANHSPTDRWGNTPLDDAIRERHQPVIAYLRDSGASSQSESQK